MAFETPLFDITFKANQDLSSVQYHMVKHTANDMECGTCSATTDTPLGVLQNKPGSLQAASVRLFGISKVVAGGAVGAGSFVVTTAAGRAATSGTGVATAYTLGIALDTVAANGEVCSVFITHAGRGA